MGNYLSTYKEQYDSLNDRFINIKGTLDTEKTKNKSLINNQKNLENTIIELKYNLEEKLNEYTTKEDILNKTLTEKDMELLNYKNIESTLEINNKNNDILNKQNIILLKDKQLIHDTNKTLENINDELLKTNIELENSNSELENINKKINEQNIELLKKVDILIKKNTNTNININNIFEKYTINKKNMIDLILNENNTIIPDYYETQIIDNIFNYILKNIKKDLDECL